MQFSSKSQAEIVHWFLNILSFGSIYINSPSTTFPLAYDQINLFFVFTKRDNFTRFYSTFIKLFVRLKCSNSGPGYPTIAVISWNSFFIFFFFFTSHSSEHETKQIKTSAAVLLTDSSRFQPFTSTSLHRVFFGFSITNFPICRITRQQYKIRFSTSSKQIFISFRCVILVLHWISGSLVGVSCQYFQFNVISLSNSFYLWAAVSTTKYEDENFSVNGGENEKEREWHSKVSQWIINTENFAASEIVIWRTSWIAWLWAHACTQFTSHKQFTALLYCEFEVLKHASVVVISLKMDSTTLKLDPKWKTNNEIWQKLSTHTIHIQHEM